jgi:cell division septation protein DedD
MAATHKIEITEHTNKNWMDRAIEQLAPYRRAILGLVLALVVGIIAITLLSRQSEQKLARAWDSYFSITEITSANEEAVRKMITELGTTEPGQMLKLKFSQYLLREGTQQLFSDKVAGKKKIDEAKAGFNSIATGSKNSLAIEESLLGSAICEAALGNQEAAIAGYEKQLKQFPQGMFSKVATTNLERIKSPAAKEWYAWFNAADVSNRSINTFPDFGRSGSGSGSSFPGNVIPGSAFPGSGSGPALEGPGSLMPSLDPLNPLGNSGVPATTPGLQNFTIPGPTLTEPAAPADGKSTPATTPMTPEKSATPEPAKSEPAAEPAKAEPAKAEPTKDVPATKAAEPAAKK